MGVGKFVEFILTSKRNETENEDDTNKGNTNLNEKKSGLSLRAGGRGLEISQGYHEGDPQLLSQNRRKKKRNPYLFDSPSTCACCVYPAT